MFSTPWKSEAVRSLANEIVAMVVHFTSLTSPRHVSVPSHVTAALESALREVDHTAASMESLREGFERVVEEQADRLEESREAAKDWMGVVEVFCQAHDIDFDPRDPDAMLMAAGECRDQS